MEVITKKVFCEIHEINYEARSYKIGKTEHLESCPKCSEVTELANQEELQKQKLEAIRQRISLNFKRSEIPPRYTTRSFDNYDCYTEKHTAALGMAESYLKLIKEDAGKGTGLILSGGVGTGKTHLACAIGNEYIKVGSVLFIKVSALIRRIRETYRPNSTKTEQQAIDEFRGIDLLIIDEIGVQRGTQDEENILFEVIDDRYSFFKSTILISNLNINEIKKYLGERAVDRMRENGGSAIVMDWESYRHRVDRNKHLPNAEEAKYK